jgi:small-conductance mechanosensitive channel
VKTCIDRTVSTAAVVPSAAIARGAGVAETFLYRHQATPCPLCLEIFGSGPISYHRAGIASLAHERETGAVGEAQFTNASLRAELDNAKAAATRLRQQVHALEQQLGQLRGRAVETALQVSVRPTWTAAKVSLEYVQPGPASDHRAAGRDTGGDTVGLVGELEDLRHRLAAREEELTAVRRLNADLTRRLNTP